MPDLSAVEKAVYGSCIKQIVSASNGAIKDDEAKALLKNLSQIKKLVTSVSQTAPIKSILPQVLNQALQSIRTGKMQKAFQIKFQAQKLADKAALVAAYPKASQQLDIFYGNLLGTYDRKNGGKFSTDVRMATAVNLSVAKLDAMLKEQGLNEHFSKGVDEEKVAQELGELTKTNGKPGITSNKDALRVAQVIHNHRAPLLKEAARSGIFVPERQGYTSQQTHDPDIIRGATFPIWSKDIYPALDKFETFGMMDPKDHEKALKEKYLNITSGRHQDYEQGVDNVHAPIGTNLAAKSSAQRTIHFTDALAAYEYSQKYGVRSFREQIVASATSLARRTALANEWGVNAEMNMRNVLKLIDNNAREQEDQTTLRAIDGKTGIRSLLQGKPEQVLSEVLGKTRTPIQKNFWYNFNQWLVTLRSTASLGTSAISAQTDLVNLAGHLATINGNNPVTQMAKVASKYYTPLSKDVELVARQCGMMAQALRAQLITDRFADLDSTGYASKLAGLFFKLNLLHFHDQRINNVAAALMSSHFGDLADTAHADLPMSTKTWLGRFDIGSKEWDSMRQHTFIGGDGGKYLTPVASDNIQGITEEERDLTRIKFASMFTDAANSTVPRAGARERVILYRGTAPDTWEGTAARILTLFKTFPVAMITKILNRNIYGQSKGALNTTMGVALNFAMTVVFGAAIYALKQTVSGKTSSNFDTVKSTKELLTRSITAGGGLGYLGDIALPADDKEKLSDTLTKGALGPIGGDVLDLSNLATSSIKGNEKLGVGEKDITQLASNYVPFSNHFATKFLFNYYVKYAILNSIDPDYTKKMEQNMKKQNGTSFFIPPAVNAKK